MKIKEDEFNKRLEKLCNENWKAKKIIDHNKGFKNLSEFQKKVFLKYMGISEVTFEVVVKAE